MVFSAETPGLALDCGKLINWGIAPFGRVAQLVRAPASHEAESTHIDTPTAVPSDTNTSYLRVPITRIARFGSW